MFAASEVESDEYQAQSKLLPDLTRSISKPVAGNAKNVYSTSNWGKALQIEKNKRKRLLLTLRPNSWMLFSNAAKKMVRSREETFLFGCTSNFRSATNVKDYQQYKPIAALVFFWAMEKFYMLQQTMETKQENVSDSSTKGISWPKAALYIFCLFLFQEVVFRTSFPVPEVLNFNRIAYQEMALTPDRQNFMRGGQLTWQSSLDTSEVFVHELNEYGFRDHSWPVTKEAGKKRVFVLGDSFVEGAMAAQDETIPHAFAAAAGEDYEVFNCGMIGIGFHAYMRFLVDAVPLFKPDEVVLILYANDMPLRDESLPATTLQPEFRSFFQPRLLTIQQEYKHGRKVPFRWQWGTKALLHPVPAVSNPWTLNAAQLQHHVTPEVADAMKDATLNYFRTNWILKEEWSLKQPKDLTYKLAFIQGFLKEHGAKLTVFYLPSRSQVTNHYYPFEKAYCQVNCPDVLDLTGPQYQIHRASIAANCQALRVPFFDLTPVVAAREVSGNHLYWNFDDHMKGPAYDYLGKVIYAEWLRLSK